MKIFQMYGLKFDETKRTYIRFPHVDIGDDFTITAWVKLHYVSDDTNRYFLSMFPTVAVMNVRCCNGKYSGVIFSSTYIHYYDGKTYPTEWKDDVWQHWVLRHKDDKWLLSIDGEYIVNISNNRVVGIYENYPELFVGSYYPTYGLITGTIGEIRIYDRYLSDDEVNILRDGGHIKNGLVFWLLPSDDYVEFNDDGSVSAVYDRVNHLKGVAHNGVMLVPGKDVEGLKKTVTVKHIMG